MQDEDELTVYTGISDLCSWGYQRWDEVRRQQIAHNYIGCNHIGSDFIGYDHIDHNFTGQDHLDHNFIGDDIDSTQ